jgi:GTP-binding protein Era
MNNQTSFKSGFVSLLGPTNAGKSTLFNALVGKKLSIVSSKVQTTHRGMRGIVHRSDAEIVYIDTPGFQKQSERLSRLLNRVAENQAGNGDLCIWVFDVSNSRVVDQIQKLSKKIQDYKTRNERILVLNKADKIAKPSLLPLIEEIYKLDLFSEIIPLSARNKDNLLSLEKQILQKIPEGIKFYDESQVTDRPPSFLISEFIREKIFEVTREEVPYSVRIELEEWSEEEPPESKVPVYRAVIHVDSDSRKGILIGKGGLMLKEIGVRARKEIENYLGEKICLKLFVDVEKDWKEDSHKLNRYLELES